MKNLKTLKHMKIKNIIKTLLLTLSFSVGTHHLTAQFCQAYNSLGCGVDYIVAVTIKNAKGQTVFSSSGLSCASTGSGYNYLMNAGSPITATYGDELEITITNGPSYAERIGIWVDVNRDNQLSTAECISGPTGPFATIAVNQTITAKVKIPCASGSGGKSYMRIRTMYAAFTAGQGCGTYSNEGNILDFEMNLIGVSNPKADFAVPSGNAFVKTPINFLAQDPNAAYSYNWSFPGGTSVQNTTSNGIAKYATQGQYDVKMVVGYCGVKDSIIKTINVIKPTAAPVADFISSSAEWEYALQYQLFDLSTNGANQWNWEITGPKGFNTVNITRTTQNPILDLYDLGEYDVCLTATNDIGPSAKVCKQSYIKVIPPTEYVIGPQKEAPNKKGRLYDNGGSQGPYSNNCKVFNYYFKIIPCGAKFIELTFTELKLQDVNDKIHIMDGDNSGAKEILTLTSANQADWIGKKLRSSGSAFYITFESNASGNNDGFIIDWDSDLLPPTLPKADFAPDFNPSGNGVEVQFKNMTTEALGLPNFTWSIDGADVGINKDFSYRFFSDNVYSVCLVANTCAGNDTICKNITITTPVKPGFVDFSASNFRPSINEVVTLPTTTDFASNFLWSIYPTTFNYVNGTNANSRNPQIRFTANGCYTFTLKAWNAAGTRALTETTLVKNQLVCVVDPCVPQVAILSSDVGITKVELKKGNSALISKLTESGVRAYSDYTDEEGAKLDFCGYYTIDVARATNSNPANFKAWIDFNIDGDFDDAGELVLNSGAISGTAVTSGFSVPSLQNSFEGKTRLRVGVAFGNFSNTSCGVNTVGEFEDYNIILVKDEIAPKITLTQGDTVYVEKTRTVNGCFTDVAASTFSAEDNIQGDLTSLVEITSNVDCSLPGIYTIDYKVCDCSGNCGTARRKVYVVLDKTAPELNLIGNDTVDIEQCTNYNELGATATDIVDGNLTNAINISGTVNSKEVGNYLLTYTVSDAQRNSISKTRLVRVLDRVKPSILYHGSKITNGMVVQVSIGQTFVDEVIAVDECNGDVLFPNFRKVSGFTGPVDGTRIGEYTVTYFAEDLHGNISAENGFSVIYKVNDYISPAITFTTGDTVYHDVTQAYITAPVLVSDNYYEVNDIRLVRLSSSVDAYKLGTYAEVWKATDASNNVTTKTRFVKVIDRVAPVIQATNASTCIGVPFWAMSGVTVTDNYYKPSDLIGSVQVVNHDVNIWEAGLYTITYQVTDPSNNTSQLFNRMVLVSYPPNCRTNLAGVEDLKFHGGIKLYPVPAKGSVNIELNGIFNEITSVEIMNAVGRVVISNSNAHFVQGVYKQDLGQLAAGIYTVKVNTKAGVVSQNFVIKE